MLKLFMYLYFLFYINVFIIKLINMNHKNPTKQLSQKSHVLMHDRSSVFNCNSKPISYIKGDTVHISEFTEESMNSSRKGLLLAMDTNSLKKYSLGGSVEGRYNKHNGDDIKSKNIVNKKNVLKKLFYNF
jgi:hypothetical protein